ncbi:NAD(P)H-dependent flavin oxidoreductase [Shewanella zhangzhouensis]|uniref:NAD(P)H-dependent flavin oxidoreductase n=1 Tax=Shewanella zhangzhouensis TaxID=2864213 RepID=UPI001C654DCE|nr:nitronate monooxygenase [Shewanella zhangzhouensis]QYK04386.1 nitronate monooxygenase [Shewanella zhangzhouensis]
MSNKLQPFLGTALPIIQAPMAGVQDSDLAIAVCNAGGLGSLPCGMLGNEVLQAEIHRIQAATSAPFNLNFFCHRVSDYPDLIRQRWQSVLAPYFDELGVTASSGPAKASRQPFSHDVADVIEAARPAFVSFHFGLPDKALLQRVKSWGTRVLSSATTLDEALWLEANGADGIILQGLEAGGHRGMFLSMELGTQQPLHALLALVKDRLTVPVIAAGGLGCSADINAAFKAGADAVQIGTAYLLCDEAKTSAIHRRAIVEQPLQTQITTLFSGRPARGIVNRAMAELGPLHEAAPPFPFASIDMGLLRQAAEQQGKGDFSPLWCGQNTSGCRDVPAAELTRDLAAGLTL